MGVQEGIPADTTSKDAADKAAAAAAAEKAPSKTTNAKGRKTTKKELKQIADREAAQAAALEKSQLAENEEGNNSGSSSRPSPITTPKRPRAVASNNLPSANVPISPNPVPPKKPKRTVAADMATLISGLKRIEEKLATANTGISNIQKTSDAIKTNTDKIPGISTRIEDVHTAVTEILVEGMDANLALDFLNEVTYVTKDPNISILVTSELGKGFAAWMKLRRLQIYNAHIESFQGVSYRMHARVLVEMLDALQRAGHIRNFKQNWLGRQNVILGAHVTKKWRKNCPKYKSRRGVPKKKKDFKSPEIIVESEPEEETFPEAAEKGDNQSDGEVEG
ncbi:hypothetical protein HK097_011258, partial [Rhizophlyctis rosea]